MSYTRSMKQSVVEKANHFEKTKREFTDQQKVRDCFSIFSKVVFPKILFVLIVNLRIVLLRLSNWMQLTCKSNKRKG